MRICPPEALREGTDETSRIRECMVNFKPLKKAGHKVRPAVTAMTIGSTGAIDGFHSNWRAIHHHAACLHHMIFLPSSFYGERC